MRAKRRILTGWVLALTTLTPACDAPKVDTARERNELAAKVVTQSARIREGELVWIVGAPRDVEVLEDLAVQVRKQGAHPLISIKGDRLAGRLYNAPDKYNAQTPEWDLKIAGLMDAEIEIDSGDKSALAGVPAERIAAVEKTYQPVFAEMRRRNVRYVLLGNGLYPTPSRARQFGLTEAELSKLFWDGVNADYTRLQATGRKVKGALADAKEIRLTSPNGTDVKGSILKRPVTVSDGVIGDEKRKEGGAACWTYLPAGEVYVSTAPGTAEGRVVLDRVFYKGKEIDDLVMAVKGGKVVSLRAKAGDEELRSDFAAAAEGKDRFGVIDVGVNDDVRPPAGGKALTYMQAGMISVYVGNDTWAGGDDNTPFSLDGFLPGGTLTADGKVIVDKGVLKP